MRKLNRKKAIASAKRLIGISPLLLVPTLVVRLVFASSSNNPDSGAPLLDLTSYLYALLCEVPFYFYSKRLIEDSKGSKISTLVRNAWLGTFGVLILEVLFGIGIFLCKPNKTEGDGLAMVMMPLLILFTGRRYVLDLFLGGGGAWLLCWLAEKLSGTSRRAGSE